MTETYDIAIFGDSLPCIQADGGRVVGAQKLIQRWIVHFLTDTESVRYSYGRSHPAGTTFMRALRSGELATEAAVFAQFRLSGYSLAAALRTEETADTPAAERYRRCRLLRLELHPDMLILHVAIVSAVAEHQIKLPIRL